jgi:hypothetical protein
VTDDELAYWSAAVVVGTVIAVVLSEVALIARWICQRR